MRCRPSTQTAAVTPSPDEEDMKVRIHRGTKEIGGTCIEMAAHGKRIALDVGLPLDAGDEDHERLLPAVPGLP